MRCHSSSSARSAACAELLQSNRHSPLGRAHTQSMRCSAASSALQVRHARADQSRPSRSARSDAGARTLVELIPQHTQRSTRDVTSFWTLVYSANFAAETARAACRVQVGPRRRSGPSRACGPHRALRAAPAGLASDFFSVPLSKLLHLTLELPLHRGGEDGRAVRGRRPGRRRPASRAAPRPCCAALPRCASPRSSPISAHPGRDATRSHPCRAGSRRRRASHDLGAITRRRPAPSAASAFRARASAAAGRLVLAKPVERRHTTESG